MTKDLPGEGEAHRSDLNLMLGYRVDKSANPNAFPMTDETICPSSLTVSVEGTELLSVLLPDCPADCRGILSHFYQLRDDRLDEIGTYGYLCRAVIDASLAAALPERFEVSLTVDRGLSLFGRRSGRYPCGIDITTN